MVDSRRGARQTAYQILVASSADKLAENTPDLWDSGKVASDQATQIVYGGKALGSRDRCYWKVRIWDAGGEPSRFSDPSLWTMGLLEAKDVKAKWIGMEERLIHPVKKDRSDQPGPEF